MLHQENRRRDGALDSQLRAFKLKFYPEFGLEISEEVQDRQRQVKGLDIIASRKGTTEILNIDEKCSCSKRSLEKGLNTFIQELQFTLRGEYSDRIMDGWAISNDKLTTHYMLFIPIGTQEDERITRITSMSAYLVSKENIEKYFESYGYTMREILEIFNSTDSSERGIDENNPNTEFLYLKKKDSLGRVDKVNHRPYNVDDYIKVVQSYGLPEEPICIPIPRKHLGKIGQVITKTYSQKESGQLLDAAESITIEEVNDN